jgi:hypothetical protein
MHDHFMPTSWNTTSYLMSINTKSIIHENDWVSHKTTLGFVLYGDNSIQHEWITNVKIYIYVLAVNLTSPISLGKKSKTLIEVSFNISPLNVYSMVIKESPRPLICSVYFFFFIKLFTIIVNELHDHLMQG